MKRFIAVILLFTLTVTLCSCLGESVDLQPYDPNSGAGAEYVWSDGLDYRPYYELFDEVITVDQDGTHSSVDMYDLFNEDTWNNSEIPDDSDIPEKPYILVCVKPSKDIEISDFNTCFPSSVPGKIDIYAFISDTIPDGYHGFYDTQYNNNDQSGLLNLDNAVFHKETSVGKVYDSVSINKWNLGGLSRSTITLSTNQYFILLFYSNTAEGKNESLNPVPFKMMNMFFSIS